MFNWSFGPQSEPVRGKKPPRWPAVVAAFVAIVVIGGALYYLAR